MHTCVCGGGGGGTHEYSALSERKSVSKRKKVSKRENVSKREIRMLLFRSCVCVYACAWV